MTITSNISTMTVVPIVADLYISPTGNDNNPGTLEQPVKTIRKGISIADPGNILYAFNGTYFEKVTINKSVRLLGQNNVNTIIDGTNIPAPSDYSDWERGLVELRASNATFSGFKVQNSKVAGIISANVSNLIIEKNQTYKTWGSGIQIHDGSNIKVKYNEINNACSPDTYHRIPQEQFSVASPRNNMNGFEIAYNYIHEKAIADDGTIINGVTGMYVKQGAKSGSIHHNYLLRTGTLYIDGWDSTCENIEIYENLMEYGTNGFQASAEIGGIVRNVSFRDNIAYRNKAFGFRTPVGASSRLTSTHITNLTIKNNIFYKNISNGIKFGSANLPLPIFSNIVIEDNIVCNNLNPQIYVDSRIPKSAYTISGNHTEADYISQAEFDIRYNALKNEILSKIP